MALDWLPIYPTQITQPRTSGMSVSVQNLDPIPTPDPPTDLTWHPTYPDQTHRAARVVWQAASFRWPMVPIADTRWYPRYPNQLRRPALGVSRMPSVFTVLGTQQAVATGMLWRAIYPSQLRRPSRVPASQRVYPIQGSTILTGASCVEWSDETATRPEMAPEAFDRPGMTCQPGGGYLLLEDGGHLLLEDGGKILLEDQAGIPCESFVRPTLVEEDWC